MRTIRIEKLSEEELRRRGVHDWPIWTSGVSRFDWHYDTAEECYILEGHVVVETDQGSVEIGKGDFVTFPQGLSCTWDVKEPVRKHYNFP